MTSNVHKFIRLEGDYWMIQSLTGEVIEPIVWAHGDVGERYNIWLPSVEKNEILAIPGYGQYYMPKIHMKTVVRQLKEGKPYMVVTWDI